MPIPRTLVLKCPSCGGKLEIASDMEQFACGYCGTEQVVVRRGGTVSLKPVVEAIERVQQGTDKVAAEMALKRLQEELKAAEGEYVTLLPIPSIDWPSLITGILFLGVSVPFVFIPFFAVDEEHAKSSQCCVLPAAIVAIFGLVATIGSIPRNRAAVHAENARRARANENLERKIADLQRKIAETRSKLD